ncbi:hypothetical protein KM043_007566 [Ampulex compressa]|nr:hypothetical protein KM043_007566 [Ampulex compressa]
MEKRSITGRDILRMDGLLPPTRRLPVCNAVSSTSEKKKEKKWSIGGILRRISSIKDYDSSSNEEEIVYCKKEPRNRVNFARKSNGVVLRPLRNSSDRRSSKKTLQSKMENNVSQSIDGLNIRRDSAHSRSSDGSLDGVGRKIRKNKLKARAEAKRDRLCIESSSDEDSRKSCGSLNRIQNEEGTPNSQKSNSINRKTRAARTERYIKRLSKDEAHGASETLTDTSSTRNSLDCANESQHIIAAQVNGCHRPPIRPRRFPPQFNNRIFPTERSSTESLREPEIGFPDVETGRCIDFPKYPADQYITDYNQNNAYKKSSSVTSREASYENIKRDRYYPCGSMADVIYAEPCEYSATHRSNRGVCPPEPPPRDPRRVFPYGCHSFPFNNKHQRLGPNEFHASNDTINGTTSADMRNLRSYGSSNEIGWRSTADNYRCRPVNSCDLRACTNNRHNSTGRHVDSYDETEAMKCRRRNCRNEQLNTSLKDHPPTVSKSGLPMSCEPNTRESFTPVSTESLERSHVRTPSSRRTSREISSNTPVKMTSGDATVDNVPRENVPRSMTPEEIQERKRSSKNLEEALSELEAIYNSLRLGDEDLLDRAERRSMEEFSLRRGKKEEDPPLSKGPESPDRSKDDMAYRRMHPKERPTSLSDAVGQSTLSTMSYLIASPVLSRKAIADDYAVRRGEPDVTRDDVVYRSINYANKTLKVVEPQPPFGIPLGPVTTATDSDYLHTVPTKPDHPRSSYIPQCEPDIVTDDLAYRSLRKEGNGGRSPIDCKCAKDAKCARDVDRGTRKKRAVRSLSANLYGLINHDRIQLHRGHPRGIEDEFNGAAIDAKPLTEQSEYFRRVLSDGELSDRETTRRRVEDSRANDTDINGNHRVSSFHRKKLRVYVSPSSKVRGLEKESGDTEGRNSEAALTPDLLADEFWHGYLLSDRKDPPLESNDKGESDFTAYTRLCQDLVDLIKGPDDAEVTATDAPVADSLIAPTKIDGAESRVDEPTVLRIQSLGSSYADRVEDSRGCADEESIERLCESVTNLEEKDERAQDGELDFYYRLADENVKLIAEAFSSVADHLQDSCTARRSSLTPRRLEKEDDSVDVSTRSSIVCNVDEAKDEQSGSWKGEKSTVVPKINVSMVEDVVEAKYSGNTYEINTDAELDLSKAVYDLQLAAASLCEHGKDIEELEARYARMLNNNGVAAARPANAEKEEGASTACERENEIEELETRCTRMLSNDDCNAPEVTSKEEESTVVPKETFCRETPTPEVERGQQETVLPADIEARGAEPDSSCEGAARDAQGRPTFESCY